MKGPILLTPNTSLDPSVAQAGSQSLKFNESPLLTGSDNQQAMAVEYNTVGIRYTLPVVAPTKTAVPTTVQTTFGGIVSGAGGSVHLPTGWTVAHTGTGQYTITHNLNTVNYATVAGFENLSQATVFISSRSATQVGFFTKTTAGAFIDQQFHFILVLL